MAEILVRTIRFHPNSPTKAGLTSRYLQYLPSESLDQLSIFIHRGPEGDFKPSPVRYELIESQRSGNRSSARRSFDQRCSAAYW